MRTILILLAVCSAVFADDYQDEPKRFISVDAYRAMNPELYAVEDLQRTIQEAADRQAIISAFPNNPALWNYLARNPRYIDLYLRQR